jgi:hypothetical protein
MTHRCITQMNAHLAAKNTRLTFAMELPSGVELLVVATEKVDAGIRGRPVRAMATFCPWCGEKVDKRKRSAK